MKPLLLLLSALVWCGSAAAQLSVQLRADKEVYLLYESIGLTIGLRNNTGRNLELLGGDQGHWLDFIVTDEHGRLVPALPNKNAQLGKVLTQGNTILPPGQTLNRTIDLLPLYQVRERGQYRVQARVRQAELHALSAPVSFSVAQGRELWRQTATVATAQGDESRTYSLLAHRLLKEDALYLCIQDEPNRLVYGLVSLGGLIPLSDPEARIDRDGHLHVLFQTAPGSFGYVEFDANAQPQQRAVYSDKLSRPRLVTADGRTSVSGGTQTHPRPERVLSEAELNPPPPPPLPPKRRWWWPFGSRPSPVPE